MKSLFRIATVLMTASLLIFTGCLGFTKPLPDDPVVYDTVTYEGVLQSLGSIKFNPDATHLLRLDDGTVLYVYSDIYNLWGPEFLNQRMEVSGYLIPADDDVDKDTISIDRLEVIEVEEVDLEVVRMEVYTDEVMGFAMNYRSDWELSSTPSSVIFTAPEPEVEGENVVLDMVFDLDVVTISTLQNAQELAIEEWFLEYINESPYSLSVVSQDQIPAIKVTGDLTTYYIDGGTTVFEIIYTPLQEDYRLEYSNLFSEMLFSFDLLSDGQREPVEEAPIVPVVSDPEEVDVPTQSGISESSSHQATISDLEDEFADYVSGSGSWVARTYEFVDPDYVYVIYSDAADESRGRILLRILGSSYELLATFEVGQYTDWELVSGTDEAKGKEKVTINAAAGTTITVLEGYRLMESATLDFKIQYPSYWFYARSGDNIYFSDSPANAGNSLITLTIMDSSIGSSSESTSNGVLTILAPRDGDQHYQLKGSSDYGEHMRVMADSIVSTG